MNSGAFYASVLLMLLPQMVTAVMNFSGSAAERAGSTLTMAVGSGLLAVAWALNAIGVYSVMEASLVMLPFLLALIYMRGKPFVVLRNDLPMGAYRKLGGWGWAIGIGSGIVMIVSMQVTWVNLQA